MSIEDLEIASKRYKLASFIGNELVLMKKSGRLDDLNLKWVKDDQTQLAYQLIEKLENLGYVILFPKEDKK